MPETLFTKEQVQEMMRKRVERSHKSFFERYGVKDLSELDKLFDKANSLDVLQPKYDDLVKQHDELTKSHADLVKKYAFNVKNIDPEKYEDIETHFKGKNLAIDEASLENELSSHQDWVKPVSTIESIGSQQEELPQSDGIEEASKFFGVSL